MKENPALIEAASRGRRAALELDARLRDREAEERALRLAGSSPPPGDLGDPSIAAVVDTLRMRDELEALRQYRVAVERSRVWRVAQFLRRMVGRAW